MFEYSQFMTGVLPAHCRATAECWNTQTYIYVRSGWQITSPLCPVVTSGTICRHLSGSFSCVFLSSSRLIFFSNEQKLMKLCSKYYIYYCFFFCCFVRTEHAHCPLYCYISIVPNQPFQSDLWPQASARNFPLHWCCSLCSFSSWDGSLETPEMTAFEDH